MSLTKCRKKLRTDRKQKGYALIAVMTISAFSLLLLFCLAGLGAQVFQTESYFKQKNQGLESAEVGLNYTLKLMNDALKPGSPPCVLAPDVGESERLSDLPSDYVPSGTIVRIRVKNIDKTMISEITGPTMLSSLIERQWDPNAYRSMTAFQFGEEKWQDFAAPSVSKYWMVEVTSYRGAFATSLRAFLVPSTNPVLTQNSTQGYFPSSVVANSGLDAGTAEDGILVAPATEIIESGAQNAEFTASLQSNSTINLGPGSFVLGNLFVSNPDGQTLSQNVVSVSGEPTGTEILYGRVATNGGVDATLKGTNGAEPQPGDNVLASADLASGSARQGENLTPINKQSNLSPQIPVQVPQAPRTSMLMPAFPQDDGGDSYPDIQLGPGDYTVDHLDSNNAASKIVVNSQLFSQDQPTRVFINPNTAADSAININSELFQNHGSSTNLQIFYSGNKPITIRLDGVGEFKGLIFAPNSSITTTGTGDFYGAIVGNKVNIHHFGSLWLDSDARKMVTQNNDSSQNNGKNVPLGTPDIYRLEGWQHLTGALVPKASGS